MKFILTTQSQEQITELLRQYHEKNPKDSYLEISGSSPFAAIVLASNIPSWVQSIYLHDIPNDIRSIFEINLTKDQKNLIQDERSLAADVSWKTEREFSLKKQRCDPEQASESDLGRLFTLRDPLTSFLSVISDISLLQAISGIGRKQRLLAYLRILQLDGDENFPRQKFILGTFIKKASVFLKDTTIKTALMTYRNREDLPRRNRILIATCLAITAGFANISSEFQTFMQEVFVLSAEIEFSLFFILCDYIDLYFGKKNKGEIDIGYKKPGVKRKIEWDAQKVILVSSPPPDGDSIKKILKDCNKLWPYVLGCLELERELFGIILQFFMLLRKVEPNHDYFPFDFFTEEDCVDTYSKGMENKFDFVSGGYFPASMANEFDRYYGYSFPISMANEFAEFCFSVNCFELKLNAGSLTFKYAKAINFKWIVQFFSPKRKQKVAADLYDSLEKLLTDPHFNLAEPSADSPEDFYNACKEIDGILKILRTCSFQKLVEFFRNQINVLLGMPEAMAVSTTRFHFIIQFISKKIAILLVKDLYAFYQHIMESFNLEARAQVAKIIIYLPKQCIPDSLSWNLSVDLGWYATFLREARVSSAQHAWSHRVGDSIVTLYDRCKNHSLPLINLGDKDVFFVQNLDDFELNLMLIRCSFENEEEFTAFVRERIGEKVNSPESWFAKLAEGTSEEKLLVLPSIVALAPYMKVELIENFLNEVNLLILKQIEPLDESLVFHLLQTLTNLIFYISPEKRQSFLKMLPEKTHNMMINNESTLTLHALSLIFQKEELRQIPGILNYLIALFYPPREDHRVHNGRFIKRKLELAKRIVILLYRERKDLDFGIILGSIAPQGDSRDDKIFATMCFELFNANGEDSAALFESFKKVSSRSAEVAGFDMVSRLQDILSHSDQGNETKLTIEPIAEMQIG